MLKNKKALAMSVLCAIASVGFVVSASAAEQTMHGNLDEVVVEGSADVLPGGDGCTARWLYFKNFFRWYYW